MSAPSAAVTAPNEFPRDFYLAPRYQLLSLLGEGLNGRVYAALDRQLGARIALKELKRADGAPPPTLPFRALKQLEHPNLLRLFELDPSEAQAFYTMQLIEGADLVSALRRPKAGSGASQDNPLILGQRTRQDAGSVFSSPPKESLSKLRQILSGVCAGLSALHRAGFIHRDITPQNIRISPQGNPVIIDFDLALSMSDASDAALSPAALEAPQASFIGTSAYMAPEQWDSAELSPALDWYALGVVLFEALCGEVPFVGSAHEVFMRKRSVSGPPPSLLLPEIPRDLDRICAGLMQSDPKRRWTAQQILTELAEAAE